MHALPKPVIGISIGDINGIGPEIILKTLSDARILEFCTPVVFANQKFLVQSKKFVQDATVNFQLCSSLEKINPMQVQVLNVWEEEASIEPGKLSPMAGKLAVSSLVAATSALQQGTIDGLVTAPIHKSNVQSEQFDFTGHTPFLQYFFKSKDVLMLLAAENIRVALATEHVPVSEVSKHLNKELLFSKLRILTKTLQTDFGISKPRIAVLGLNPHAGDEGLIGSEEETIIKPAIKDFRDKNNLVFGPYSADAFFARHQYQQFDAVLAMYHDQGLIPFKSLANGEGVNITCGLPVIRTSPDHGTAFDIAGKNKASAESFTEALFECVRIVKQRREYQDMNSNPLRKRTKEILGRMDDEVLSE